LQSALGDAGQVASVTGSIVRHDPFNIPGHVEHYLRLRVEVAFEDDVRALHISDRLSLWEHADERTLDVYAATYARSVVRVLAARQLTAEELGADQWDGSRGDPGWTELLAAAHRGRRPRQRNQQRKAPEAAVRE
jgi:hypothetical protein